MMLRVLLVLIFWCQAAAAFQPLPPQLAFKPQVRAIDARTLEVRFASLSRLVSDLRDQGLGNVLARHGPPLGRAAIDRASRAFGNRTVERFEIITLSGWKR